MPVPSINRTYRRIPLGDIQKLLGATPRVIGAPVGDLHEAPWTWQKLGAVRQLQKTERTMALANRIPCLDVDWRLTIKFKGIATRQH